MWGRRTLAILSAVAWCGITAPVDAADLENGQEIFEVCAPCHGPFGQGGGGGVYPRLAGMSELYLFAQLSYFKSRQRENIPMVPFTTERELPDEDIRDVAAYISSLTLATHLPPMKEGTDALERLLETKKTLNVPRAPGDLVAGRKIYDEDCARCHGNTGTGTKRGPLLAGQHSRYLGRQIEHFLAGARDHKSVDVLFGGLSQAQIGDILAYLSILDDQVPGDDKEDDDDE